jgi:hypothetical protein
MTRDYKHVRPTDRPSKSALWIVLSIICIVALFGWMGNRDQEHLDEIEFQKQVIDSLVHSCIYDSAPAVEMSMPVGRVES